MAVRSKVRNMEDEITRRKALEVPTAKTYTQAEVLALLASLGVAQAPQAVAVPTVKVEFEATLDMLYFLQRAMATQRNAAPEARFEDMSREFETTVLTPSIKKHTREDGKPALAGVKAAWAARDGVKKTR
jgi:hypothetical protein